MPPPEIDLIEILYAHGKVSMPMVIVQVGSSAAWRVIPALARANVAEMWVSESGELRRLIDWEVARLLRNRLAGSAEPAPPDDALVLRAGEGIVEAYERDFGAWYDSTLGHQRDHDSP